MSAIFTEELDRARIDLNEAERKMHKAEFAQREAEKLRRQESERADTLNRRLQDLLVQSDSDHKTAVQLRQKVDRLESMEPELVRTKSELRDANDRCNRYVDQNEELQKRIEDLSGLLQEKRAECQMLVQELTPTRTLLGSLRVFLQAQKDMESELERLAW
jgi:predicted  nucleic acid-binding Zn-ribbon protein